MNTLDFSGSFLNIQDSLIQLENCEFCSTTNGPCTELEHCTDIFNCLNKLSNHYQKLRTLKRRLYELRSLNICLLELDNILEEGVLEKIQNFLNVTAKSKVIL